jgi:hypothetical protein
MQGDVGHRLHKGYAVEKIVQIKLDEKLQIIRQHLSGDVDDTDHERIVSDIQACVDRLKDPGNVRILVNAQGLGRGNARIRRAMIADQKRPNLKKIAFWNGSIMLRTALRFLSIAGGNEKIRHFKTEQEALSWLLS